MPLTLEGDEPLEELHDAWQLLSADHMIERDPKRRRSILADIDLITDAIQTQRQDGEH